MKHTTITAGEMRKLHGRPVRFETGKGVVCEGKISVNDSGAVYIAHNNFNLYGGIPEKMLGYTCGWKIYYGSEQDTHADNDLYNWIEILDELPKDFGKMKDEMTSKPTLITLQEKKVKYSDDDTTYTKDTITFEGKEYTKEQLQEHVKKARRVLGRFNRLSF